MGRAENLENWCPGTDLNCRHGDFQFARLPVEKWRKPNVSAGLSHGNVRKYRNETRIVTAQESAQFEDGPQQPICPVTGTYCTGMFCDDYGCAKEAGFYDDEEDL